MLPSMARVESPQLDQAERAWRRALVVSIALSPLIALAILRWGVWLVYPGGPVTAAGISGLAGAKGLMLMGMVISVPLCGLAGIRLQRKLGWWGVEVAVVVLSLIGLLGAECVIRNRRVQGNLWVALLERLGPLDWGLREPAQLHYENLHAPDSREAGKGVSVYGASQAAVNLDRGELAGQLGCPVFGRALNGMFALEMCAAQHLLAVPRVQTAVFYLSPLDLSANYSVRADWMRCMISPPSWLDVIRVLGPGLAWKNRGALAELGVAAHLKLWSFRDGVRWILYNLAGRSPSHTPSDPEGARKEEALRPFWVDPAYVEAGFRGYELVMERLKAMGTEVVVFEGEVNPDLRRQIPDSYWVPTEERIETFFHAHQVLHVPLREYEPGVGPEDWADHTHMNNEGRRRLTAAVGAKLLEHREAQAVDP